MTNRPGHPSPDATRFAPVVPTDLSTTNFDGQRTVPLGAHVKVFPNVTTKPATQPDYMIFTDLSNAPPYPRAGVRARFLGRRHCTTPRSTSTRSTTTPPTSRTDPAGDDGERPDDGAVVFLGLPTGAFDTVRNVNYTKEIGPKRPSAVPDLITELSQDLRLLLQPVTLAQNFRLMSPFARKIVEQTGAERRLLPSCTPDVRGNAAPTASALTPSGSSTRHGRTSTWGRSRRRSLLGRAVNLDSMLSPRMHRSVRRDGAAAVADPLRDRPEDAVAPSRGARPYRILSSTVGHLQRPGVAADDPASIGIVPVEPLALACSPAQPGRWLSTILPRRPWAYRWRSTSWPTTSPCSAPSTWRRWRSGPGRSTGRRSPIPARERCSTPRHLATRARMPSPTPTWTSRGRCPTPPRWTSPSARRPSPGGRQ